MNRSPYLLNLIFLINIFLCTANTAVHASNANWMANIPKSRQLNQLIIPGTHDSGSYAITADSKFSLSKDDPLPPWIEAISNLLPKSMIRPIVSQWSKTQPESLTEQLNNGIRYFDMRVCFDQTTSELYLCHALLSTKLENALQQIQQFAIQHPTEIIIVDFNHLYQVNNADTQTALIKQLKKFLSELTVSNLLHANNTIGDILKTKHNVIVIMDVNYNIADKNIQSFASQNLWHQSQIESPWPNVATDNELKNTLDAEISFRTKNYKNSQQLFVLQIIKTENSTQIINGILNPQLYPTSIESYENTINNSLATWLKQYIATYGFLPINIVMIDWFDNTNNLINLAKDYNYLTTQKKPRHSIDQVLLQQLKIFGRNLLTKAMEQQPQRG